MRCVDGSIPSEGVIGVQIRAYFFYARKKVGELYGKRQVRRMARARMLA